MESAVGDALQAFGKLNVLVNNAGIATYGPIEEYSHADWEKTIRQVFARRALEQQPEVIPAVHPVRETLAHRI